MRDGTGREQEAVGGNLDEDLKEANLAARFRH